MPGMLYPTLTIPQSLARLVGLTTPLLLALVGCGSTVPEPAKTAAKTEAADERAAEPKEKVSAGRCARSNRTGEYHLQLQGISSSCPSIPDFDVQWDKGETTLDAGCTLDKPDKWSSDGCSVEHLVTCQTKVGSMTKMVMVSSPESDDGSIYAGVVSIKKLDASGSETCQGTFRFIASKS